MSQKNTYNIACPKCKESQNVELYESISVTTDPELRDLLMNHQLNVLECESCGFSFRVEKPILYHDAENAFMIYFFPVAEGDHEEGQRQFRNSLGTISQLFPDDVEIPQVHLAFSKAELVERIFYLEEGLDERLIEYVKFLIYTKNLEKIPPAKKTILYDSEDSTEDALCFVVQDLETMKLEGMLHYSRDAYHTLGEMFDQDEQTANLLEIFPGPYINARRVLLSEKASDISTEETE